MNLTSHSWISDAPEHWTRGRLKTLIAKAANGVWGEEPAGNDSAVYCVRGADFDRVRQRVSRERLPLRSIERKTFRKHALKAGELILEKSGGGENQPVGAAVLFDLAEPAVCSNFCARIAPASSVEPRFLSYVFAAAYSQGLTQSSIKQTTGIQNLDSAALFASPWAYPTIGEQRCIADFLDAETLRIDRFTSLQEEVLELLDERNRASLDLAIEDYSTCFGTLPLRRYTTGVEQGTSPQCDAVPAGDDEWGVLKVSCLRPCGFYPTENKRLPDDVVPEVRHEVRAGDLLVVRANTPLLVGATAVVGSTRPKLLLSDKIFRIRLVAGIDPQYVAAVAGGSRVRSLCAAASNGASQSMANIRFEEVKDWPIPRATLSRQKQLVERVTRIQAEIGRLCIVIERQLALLAERRQALITAAVTGQIDVTTARGVDVS